jgi:hypothetical protein
MHRLAQGAGPPSVTTRKPVNRSVYEGADMISLRLRAAKKPAVIPFLEIPPEEIDLEPVTLEPVALTDAEPMPIMPLIVPASEILPFDDEEVQQVMPASASERSPGANAPGDDPKPPANGPSAPADDGLSLFGVGSIIEDKPRGKPRKR